MGKEIEEIVLHMKTGISSVFTAKDPAAFIRRMSLVDVLIVELSQTQNKNAG